MGVWDHLTCLLRNLYVDQEATVRTEYGTTYCLHLGKEYIKAVYCHSVYLTYSEYIMRNVGINEERARIKSAGGHIRNLRYTDDTTLIEESEEEPKSLLMKVKEETEKAGLKLSI